MEVKFTTDFINLLNDQVRYIARDKPKAAKKFKTDLLAELKKNLLFPFNYKKSIYFDNDLIRDYVFKGYTIVYEINEVDQLVQVFEFIKFIEAL